MMRELTAENFSEAIESELPVVVDFWADWCMPCKIFAPVLEELSDELDGKAEFCKLNVEEYADLAGEYGVEHIPTLIVFKNGEEIDRSVGVQTKDSVREMLEE